MKIVLQGFEPKPAPANSGTETPKAPLRRKSRLMLRPVAAETRLFHAL
jgi:hypothetical protein